MGNSQEPLSLISILLYSTYYAVSVGKLLQIFKDFYHLVLTSTSHFFI